MRLGRGPGAAGAAALAVACVAAGGLAAGRGLVRGASWAPARAATEPATATQDPSPTVAPTAVAPTEPATSTGTATPTATAAASPTVTATASPTATVPVSPTLAATDVPTPTEPGPTDPPPASPTPTASPTPPEDPTPTSGPEPTATSGPAVRPPGRALLPVVLRGHLAGPGIFGMQISENRFRDPEMIAAVRRAGAGWWRTFLFWDEVEPVETSPPTYDWRLVDPLFQAADDAGLKVIAEIQGNPKWVAAYPGGPPRDLDALARFVAAAVERYDGDGVADAPGSPTVRYWELYNEPDNTSGDLAQEGRGWGYWGHNGAEYARMLKRVYPVVKIVDPRAQVVLGGIALDAFLPHGPFDPQFLDDVLAAGGGGSFDVMNFHYYPLFAANWERFGPDLVGKARAVRAMLAAHGLDKPMMVTEAGLWSAAEPPYPPATETEQARYVPQLYARALASELVAVCWFQYDDVELLDDPARGLVASDGRPKPAHRAYGVAADLLAGARPAAPVRLAGDPGEVYRFERGSEQVVVAWTLDGSQATLRLAAPSVLRVHFLGSRIVVRDAADGRIDGVTEVVYGTDPVFLLVPAGP